MSFRGRRKRGRGVSKLFKKSVSMNGSSPSFTIDEKKKECSCVISILGLLGFFAGKSGTRLVDVLRYNHRDTMVKDEDTVFHAS